MPKTFFGVVATVSLLLMGCIKPQVNNDPVPTTPDKQETFLVHQVKSNAETLKSIAKWYTGSSENAAKITTVTPGLIDGKIKAGETVLIPDSIVTNRQEMPLPKVKSKTKSNQSALQVQELSPSSPKPAAVIGIYRFDQLPLPRGETAESVAKFFRTQGESEREKAPEGRDEEGEVRRRELTEELLSED